MIEQGVQKYLYLKLCWSQAMNHLTIPKQILEFAMIGGVFLKVFGINNYTLVSIVGFFCVIGAMFLGHFAIKKGLVNKETSLVNRFNPEIQSLLHNSRAAPAEGSAQFIEPVSLEEKYKTSKTIDEILS